MINKYDYVIVGSGLFGSVFAERAKHLNKKILVLEKRNHIAGNIYTENIDGINVHKYGGHIWHTASKKIHDYMCQFCTFNNYNHTVKVNFNNKIYSFPINLLTLHQLWGVNSPQEAIQKLEEVKIKLDNPRNLEDWAISQVGEDIYNIFIKGYTYKQWGRNPSQLPSSIIKRIPIRLTFEDNYFPDDHIYQGIPIGGYTQIVEKMLDGVEVKLEEDFFDNKNLLERISEKIIYTGPLDRFFDYSHGRLDYRSLRFEDQNLDGDFQGCVAVNYTSADVPFTRILEHKHFEMQKISKTIITREYSCEYDGKNEPYYPINDEKNKIVANIYKDMTSSLHQYHFGGRLATYNYYDMHQVVASALSLADRIL